MNIFNPMVSINNKQLILFIIVFSQFLCTSLWFASNGIMTDLIVDFNLQSTALGFVTSSVQLGFIVGTLVFAITSIVDRLSPSKLFFICAVLGALFNVGMIVPHQNLLSLLTLRFLTGFCLAGIYPVGMKIAADYFEKGLGRSLGFLVGALVLGTALPHILKDFFNAYPWELVVITTSLFAFIGGLCILLFVSDGPFRSPGASFQISQVLVSFKNATFKKAALGYFSHMWELYAFWAFVPFILNLYNQAFPEALIAVPLWSFVIIATGSLGCIVAGQLTPVFAIQTIARFSLFLSGMCCLLFPWILQQTSPFVLLSFMCVWGFFVIADSPMFSSLVALHALPSNKGTALTIVNCIGFSISIISIQALTYLTDMYSTPYVFYFLAIGPLLGLVALMKGRPIASL